LVIHCTALFEYSRIVFVFVILLVRFRALIPRFVLVVVVLLVFLVLVLVLVIIVFGIFSARFWIKFCALPTRARHVCHSQSVCRSKGSGARRCARGG
jgi:hypothetical protein